MQQHSLEHFQSPGHTAFVEDVCITFIDTAYPFTPTKRYQAACIRTMILGLDSDIRGGFGALSVVPGGEFLTTWSD